MYEIFQYVFLNENILREYHNIILNSHDTCRLKSQYYKMNETQYQMFWD
jgi:hypothetical protein